MRCKPVYIIITPFFPSPGRWKYGYGYDFAYAVQKTGQYEVKVFMPWSKGGRDHGGAMTNEDYEIKGIHVYRFHIKQLPSSIFPFAFSRYNRRSFIDAISAAGININQVAVCHMHTAVCGQFAQAIKEVNKRCKTLLHHHDLQSYGLNTGILRHCWLYNMIQFPILRRMHQQIDCHVFISDVARRSFLSAPDTNWTEYTGYKKQMRGLPYRSVKIKDSVILHNGVDKSVFNRGEGEVEVEQRRDGDSFVIGCVGNFDDVKDQMTLLRAVAILKLEGRMLRVRFVGSGPYLEECKQYAKEHNIDAEFLTEMRHEQLPDFYRSLDLFVLPSYFEGFGCVFTEAHSCGVPFIACEGQGICDVLAEVKVRGEGEQRNASPWLCKPRDPEDLAKKIGAYISRVEHGEHVEQRLNEDQDIDKLVGKFVEQVL